MNKKVLYTGFCPVQHKEVSIKIDYIHNFDCWEKGTGECEHASLNPCPMSICPIIDSAPLKI